MTWAEVFTKVEDDRHWVRWVNTDGSKHSMPFDVSRDGITALIIAMTLTC